VASNYLKTNWKNSKQSTTKTWKSLR